MNPEEESGKVPTNSEGETTITPEVVPSHDSWIVM